MHLVDLLTVVSERVDSVPASTSQTVPVLPQQAAETKLLQASAPSARPQAERTFNKILKPVASPMDISAIVREASATFKAEGKLCLPSLNGMWLI